MLGDTSEFLEVHFSLYKGILGFYYFSKPFGFFLEEVVMRPLSRGHVSKHRSASKFRHHVSTTKRANLPIMPMRGGWRL